jgi:type IV pilus assembly protein PilM
MNVNIVAQGQTVFWRDIVRREPVHRRLQKAHSLNFEQAEAKKGEPVAGQRQSIQPVLTGVSEDVAAELQKTIDFFQATSGSDRVDSIMLCGGSSKVTHLDEVLKEKFGLPVEALNPFRSIFTDDRAVDAAWLTEHSPSLAVAVGLGVRRIGE